ncbi:hypothetical protein L915_05607 [Phytophthora nicotianae]|uniref:Uncharacterized protein n=1 Tax=Phytophthora nicotianae TaxID=4792 RepID=W2JER3_PHYNI|nr:hypothetical protein L915_05607 [Phytophthora nicotianae]ETL44078.1 hypothetical protein L916_05548 [Phytophthora nicotianae]
MPTCSSKRKQVKCTDWCQLNVHDKVHDHGPWWWRKILNQ